MILLSTVGCIAMEFSHLVVYHSRHGWEELWQWATRSTKVDAVTDNVPSDQGALKQFADPDIGNLSPVNGHESVEMNMEAAISAEDVMRAGGFGAKDDIGSLLPTAMDSTDFEASQRDARDFEGEKELPSRPGLGYRANGTDDGSMPSGVPQQ